MRKLFLLSAITFPTGVFAQGPNTNVNPPAQASQMENVNYYNKIDENNFSLGNAPGDINDDANPIQTNIAMQAATTPAQQEKESGSNFLNSEENDNSQGKVKCKDCEEVKKAIAAAHSSSGTHHRKSGGMKKWGKKFSYNTQTKMKRLFAKKYKVKTTFASCFSWG